MLGQSLKFHDVIADALKQVVHMNMAALEQVALLVGPDQGEQAGKTESASGVNGLLDKKLSSLK